MPKNSSGVYSAPAGTAAVSNTVASSSDFNTLISDIASALTGDLPRNGAAGMQAALDMGSNRVEALAVATARTHAAQVGQVADGVFGFVGDLSAADTVTAVDNGFAPAAYLNGLLISGRKVLANTGAATLNYAGIGAADIELQGGVALSGGEMPAGHICLFEYDSNHNSFILLNPIDLFTELSEDLTPVLGGPLDTDDNRVRWSKGADVASATSLTLGTDGNYFTITGTTTVEAIASIGNGCRVMLRFAGILTLTHNATSFILPGGADITTAAGDTAEFIQDATGNWVCVNYSRASGLPIINPAIEFTEAFESAEQTITAGALLTIPHGLSATPKLVTAKLVCKTAEQNFSINDEVLVTPYVEVVDTGRGTMMQVDGTNILVRFGLNGSSYTLYNKTTVTAFGITNGNWRLVVSAYA